MPHVRDLISFISFYMQMQVANVELFFKRVLVHSARHVTTTPTLDTQRGYFVNVCLRSCHFARTIMILNLLFELLGDQCLDFIWIVELWFCLRRHKVSHNPPLWHSLPIMWRHSEWSTDLHNACGLRSRFIIRATEYAIHQSSKQQGTIVVYIEIECWISMRRTSRTLFMVWLALETLCAIGLHLHDYVYFHFQGEFIHYSIPHWFRVFFGFCWRLFGVAGTHNKRRSYACVYACCVVRV